MRFVWRYREPARRRGGYLVPLCGADRVSGRNGLLELREIFEGGMRGTGRAGAVLPPICSTASGRRSA